MPDDDFLTRLNDDVAQVLNASAGFGSGRLIARDLVLTACHTLQPRAGGDLVLQGWQVRLERDRIGSPAWVWRENAEVVWHDLQLDMALIALRDPRATPVEPRLRLRIATMHSNKPAPVEARGYPRASKEDDRPRTLTPALGRMSPSTADQPFDFGIDPDRLPDDPKEGWPGMSGASVLLQDWTDPSMIWLYGVAKEVPANYKGLLRVTRVAQAWQQRPFHDLLVDAGVFDHPPEDPGGTVSSDLLTFEEIVSAIRWLDRSPEIDSVRLATAEVVVCGRREDWPRHLLDRLTIDLQSRGELPENADIVRLKWTIAKPGTARLTLRAIRRSITETLWKFVEDKHIPAPDRDLADAAFLRAALAQPDAYGWFWIDVKQPAQCTEQDAAELRELCELWSAGTTNIRRSDGRPGRRWGLVIALHGVREVGDPLQQAFSALPTPLADCDPDALVDWPRQIEDGIRVRSRRGAAMVVAATATPPRPLAPLVSSWVQANAARFGPAFPIGLVITAFGNGQYLE